MSQPNERTKQHLKKNKVEPGELPNSVIDAFNSCSQEELDAMDTVVQSLEDAKVPPGKAIMAVH